PLPTPHSPFRVVAAVGDPMQIVAAGMTIAASSRTGILLAGGTQMLAVYALAEAIAKFGELTTSWQPQEIVVGTTRWVAEDPTGDTVGLAREIGGVPLLASDLNFAQSRYQQLRVYEEGYVKEGVGAGGCAIASYLYKGWNSCQLLEAIEELIARQNQR
ncbi:TIGR00303 family protein, partial [Symplocastrum sp. BBK-W-15]|nr:TIGR00303 family protein [Limnofasciculus baicalensis BBK-W-15]